MTTSLFVLFTQLHQIHSYFHLLPFFIITLTVQNSLSRRALIFLPSNYTASNRWIYHPCLKQNSQALISNIKTCEIGRMDRISFVSSLPQHQPKHVVSILFSQFIHVRIACNLNFSWVFKFSKMYGNMMCNYTNLQMDTISIFRLVFSL